MTRPAHRRAATAAAVAFGTAAAVCGATPSAAQRAGPTGPTTSPGVFVLVNGDDTVAVERLRLAGDTVIAEARSPRAPARVRLTIATARDGLVSQVRLEAFLAAAADDAPPAQQARFRFDGDTVRIDGVTTASVPAIRGTLPWLNPSMALVEQIVRRARALGSASVQVPMIDLSSGQKFTVAVERNGPDSAIVRLPTAEMRLAIAADGRVVGGVVPAQRVRITRVAAIDAGAGRPHVPDYSAPPSAPYVAEEVRVATPGGFALAGTFTRPRTAAGVRVPAVVTITGSGQSDRDEALNGMRGYRPFRDLADTLGRRGIAVLRLDDRGFGASGGSAATATSQDFASDVRAALAWLRARPDVDPARLGLVGHSEGGLIAPLVADGDTSLAAMVLMAGPAWTGRRILSQQQEYAVTSNASILPAQRDSLLARMRQATDSVGRAQPWLRFFLDYDPVPTARRVRVPTLVLQGATDRQIDPAQAEELAAALRSGGNRAVQLRTFPTTNHLFLEDPSGDPAGYGALAATRVRSDVLGVIADWLSTTLRVK